MSGGLPCRNVYSVEFDKDLLSRIFGKSDMALDQLPLEFLGGQNVRIHRVQSNQIPASNSNSEIQITSQKMAAASVQRSALALVAVKSRRWTAKNQGYSEKVKNLNQKFSFVLFLSNL